MTGYQSKKAAALDEDGMYLVHHTKRKDDDDDAQGYIAQYESALTIAYQSGYYDGKKAAQRPWVDLTDEEVLALFDSHNVYGSKWLEFARAVLAKSKEKNA
jgi:hypothetical protein